MRATWLLVVAAVALAQGGCHKTPEPPRKTRPEWAGAAIDGIAPLMTPAQVEAALNQHGYRQVRCASQDPVLPDPFQRKGAIPCFESKSLARRVSLYFLDLNEGRRLAVVNFYGHASEDRTHAQRLADGKAVAQELRARFGAPSITSNGSEFQTFYWSRPGGQPSLPDTISTTVGARFGANTTMTSMWAYGEERPSA